MRRSTEAIAHGIGVRGLLNVQYALHGETLYVLEANPRASRTVPFVSKATAVPLAKAAARIMLGASIARAARRGPAAGRRATAATCPRTRRSRSRRRCCRSTGSAPAEGHGVDSLLGPEMKSTGEVMGIDASFGTAFAKSQAAAYGSLPTSGRVFVSIADRDKRAMVFPVLRLADLGFEVLATEGTADVLRRHGIDVTVVRKHFEGRGRRETIVDLILAGEVDMIINTPYGNSGPRIDGYEIRTAAVSRGIPCITTVQGAAAAVQGIEALIGGPDRGAVAAGRARRAAQGARP